MFRQPAFGVAEIAWRWSFGLAATVLLAFSFVQYLDTLPVTRRDLFFLRTGQPALIARALARIFQGSAPHVILASLVLIPALALAWMLLGSLGRAATLKALVLHFRGAGQPVARAANPLRPLLGLHFFRVAATLAAAVGCLGAILLSSAASPRKDPAPGSAFLIFLMVIMLVSMACAVVNWFLSLSTVFVVSSGQNTLGALSSAADLCRTRTASVFAAGTWFGLAHLAAFFVASSAVAFPLAFAAILPAGVVLGGVLLVTLIYFAVSDFLYVGRLAAYVAIVELPVPIETPITPPAFGYARPAIPPSATIDKDELILSDVLAPSTQQSAPGIQTATTIDKDEPILSDVAENTSPQRTEN